MKTNTTWLMGCGLMLSIAGCPAGDDTTTDTAANDSSSGGTTMGDATMGETDPTGVGPTTGETADSGSESSGEPPLECVGIGGAGADGDACTANADCMSGMCTIYTDVPVNDDAVCEASAVDCSTRVTGTIFDFVTDEPVPGADLVVAAALQAALNPTTATALVSATSDASGQVDASSSGPLMASLGIVGLASAGGYYLTATGLASPNEASAYAVGTSIHDIWAVPAPELSDWSDALGEDDEIAADLLPLGDEGGVVGLVRDGNRQPIAGATVASSKGMKGSIIRYLNDDGTFNPDETSDLGVFVILNPGLGEEFDVSSGGAVVGTGTAGSAAGAIFTLIVTAP